MIFLWKNHIFFSFLFCLFSAGAVAQKFKHEAKISYGILNLPNSMTRTEEMKGGFTATYMYQPLKWLSVGANLNWQFPSETYLAGYSYREYYPDGSSHFFRHLYNYHFFTFAPEIRFIYTNKKHFTSYSGISFGYAVNIAVEKDFSEVESYYFKRDFRNFSDMQKVSWHFTFYGFNVNFGAEQKFFAGLEMGIGYKGLYSIHAGYRF